MTRVALGWLFLLEVKTIDPEYELIPQKSIFPKEVYDIIERVSGPEAAHKTLYDDWEVVEIPMKPMNFYFPVGGT